MYKHKLYENEEYVFDVPDGFDIESVKQEIQREQPNVSKGELNRLLSLNAVAFDTSNGIDEVRRLIKEYKKSVKSYLDKLDKADSWLNKVKEENTEALNKMNMNYNDLYNYSIIAHPTNKLDDWLTIKATIQEFIYNTKVFLIISITSKI